MESDKSEYLCYIRSGQDWSEADEKEKSMYFGDLEPALKRGMEFLTTEGKPEGCLSNRFLDCITRDGKPLDKTFSYGLW